MKICYLKETTKVEIAADKKSANAIFEDISKVYPVYILDGNKVVKTANLDKIKVARNVKEANELEKETVDKIEALAKKASLAIAKWLVDFCVSISDKKVFYAHNEDGLSVFVKCDDYSNGWRIRFNGGLEYLYEESENTISTYGGINMAFAYWIIEGWEKYKEMILEEVNNIANKTREEVQTKLQVLENFKV